MKPLFYLLSLKISGIKNIEVPIELNFYKRQLITVILIQRNIE